MIGRLILELRRFLPLAMLLNVLPVAAAAEMSVSIYDSAFGNYEVIIQNLEDDEVVVSRIVANRKYENTLCDLRPFRSETVGEIAFLRSDADTAFGDVLRVKHVILGFGDEAEAVWHRDCGAPLEMKVFTQTGEMTWSKR